MSQLDSIVESNVIDAQYSSGDTNNMKTKQIFEEENNNNIDELSKNLQMGCVVDKVMRPPNICVETCVYESGSDDENKSEAEANYSDDFDDNSDEEIKNVSKSESNVKNDDLRQPSIKMSKSHSSMASNKVSVSVKSGRSSGTGSVSSRQANRVNMSFTNDRLREIERHNHILLNKILSARNKKSSIPTIEAPIRKPVPSAALHRKNKQRQIDHDNMVLLKKIQRAKSSSYSVRR
ncbi:unnamed protein product [Leptidea sinapis]|uniref:Cilia- and flagella-associated protein 97 n=1 Tax=Leptidea sinapis TaxID=189913 RepID=A0A5E4QD19_9NEOP|nr:unnamed protein product [Leptidea sinapis]